MTGQSSGRVFALKALGGVSAIALAMVSTVVSAQDQDQDAEQSARPLEEIIVTASRREQSLQDVPASVTAVVPEDFTWRGLTSVKSVLQYVPGIRIDDGGNPGEGNISARGIPEAGATPVFGIYVDDTPLTSNSSFGAGAEVFFDGLLMDIERVEVIKGPQGTLYGATSVGGMLRYITREPALQEIRISGGADLSTVHGGDQGYRVNGRVSIPIIRGKLGVTGAAYRDKVPGYVDFVDPGTGDVVQKDADGSVVKGYSADALYVPTEDLKIRFKYLRQEMDTMLSSSVVLAGTDSTAGLFSNYSNFNEPGPVSLDYTIYSGNVTYDFDWATLTSTTSHTKYRSAQVADFSFLSFLIDALRMDGQETTGLFLTEAEGAKRFSQEVRLTSANSDKLEWIAGFFFADEDTFTTQDLAAIPAFQAAFVSFPSKYKEYAGFGDLTYYLTDNFDITAGARISKTKISLSLFQTGPFVGGDVDFNGRLIKDTVDTYLITARYRVNEDLALYSRVASGYRPAQTNLPLFDMEGNNTANPVVEADNAWSYEIGAKGSTANGMADFDISFWRIDWNNFQALFTVGGGVTVSANAEGGLNAKGFEGSLVLRPTSALTVIGNIGYTDSHLNQDEPGIGGLKGLQYPDLPKWKGSIQWGYTVDLSRGWSARYGGGLRYRGKFVSGFPASDTEVAVPVKSGVLADMNLDVTNGQYALGIYVTNLFNKRLLNDRSDAITGGVVNSFGTFERPRTIGLTLRAEY